MFSKTVEKISNEDIHYFRERNRNMVYSAVAAAFSKVVELESVTKREMAFSLGKEPSQITRWLSGPGNWTLDTVSDLLLSIGAVVDYKVSFIKDRKENTMVHPLMGGVRVAPVHQLIFSAVPTGTSAPSYKVSMR